MWKIPLAVVGAVTGIVLLLLTAVTIVLCVPSIRHKAVDKGIAFANEHTEWDIDLGHICISPFHQPVKELYRAYKGEADLPLTIEIDSLYVGHRGQDTLVYVHTLRLNAKALTKDQSSISNLQFPIAVDTLYLDQTTFHSDSLIASVGVDVVVNSLALSSPGLVIAEGKYPLHGLRINDADVGIDLRGQDTVPQDTTPLLLAFDIPDGVLRNIHFRLTPLGLDIRTGCLATNVLVDVGANLYDARRLDVSRFAFGLGNLHIPADTIYGGACVRLENNMITSNGLHVRSRELGAQLDLTATELDLESMRIDIAGDAVYQGSQAHVRGFYDIDDEVYDVDVDVAKVDLSPFMSTHPKTLITGAVHAEGQGIDPSSPDMNAQLNLHLTDAIYEQINVSGMHLDAELANKTVTGTMHLPFHMADSALRINAHTDHLFSVSDFTQPEHMTVDYTAQIRQLRARFGDQRIVSDSIRLHFETDSTTDLTIGSRGMRMNASSPMQVMTLIDALQPMLNALGDSTVMEPITSLSDLTMLDSLRRTIPPLDARIVLTKGSPVQPIIDSLGLAINRVTLALNSDERETQLNLDASTPDIHPKDSTKLSLPAVQAAMNVAMVEGRTNASLNAHSHLGHGTLNVHNLHTDAEVRMDLVREGKTVHGKGQLLLDSLIYDQMHLGNRAVDITINPSKAYPNALRTDVRLDDIPLDILDGFGGLSDIDISGALRALATIDGLPAQTDISAEVYPIGVSARYKPYNVGISLGETPIVMNHNKVHLNGLPIYCADSTYLALTGGLDLDEMRMDIQLHADSLVPAKLVKDGPIPVYGDLATDIRGRVTGPLDSIDADIDLTLLPVTDITYPIDKKNLAQVKPHGTVKVRYQSAVPTDTVAGTGPLTLGGRINVDDGFIRYSPKVYPIMPFHVDSGSHIAFHGPVGKTMINVSASQRVKANVQSEGEEGRVVDFRTGVQVKGEVDSIGLDAIAFFLEAPQDEQITEELASVDEDTREGLAAALLATGTYLGESNVAAKNSGYTLTSIINSRIDAAMTNSKHGKVVDINISSNQSQKDANDGKDYSVSLSKSLFKDRMRITVGATLADNPDAKSAVGLYGMASADVKLTKDGNFLFRIFTQRDYNNILEGDLQKSGIGVRAIQNWKRQQLYKSDSITRTYGLTADADVAYRSNRSIGPNLSLTSSVKNLMGRNETFSLKTYGAYYWSLQKSSSSVNSSNTYKLGAEASLLFPYLHWLGDHNPKGDTRYRLGYLYENIAGGIGVNKLSGSFTYFIRSPRSNFITHAFTPFGFSWAHMTAKTDEALANAANSPQLLKLLASNELVPSVAYEFTYNNYRSKRAVNTMFDIELKEGGNLVNAMYCLFGGYNWNTKNKPLGGTTFDQFVKLSTELHNKFNFTEDVCIATRLYAGGIFPLGNSESTPLSEAFYAGGTNGLRAAAAYSYGPGNYFSTKYKQSFFHAGEIKLEANVELRFPIVWKIYGAVFVDAGNVWDIWNTKDLMTEEDYQTMRDVMAFPDEFYDGIINNSQIASQIALGTGAGVRLDLEGLVIRLDLGVGIHAPYQTYKYDKDRNIDLTQPIHEYYNIPSVLDGLRINFGIGYPF